MILLSSMEIATMIGLPALILLLATNLIQGIKYWVVELSKKGRLKKLEESKLQKELSNTLSVLSEVNGSMSKVNDKLEAESKTRDEHDKLMMAGLQAVLRDALLEKYKFYMHQEYIDSDDFANYENLYNRYHELGINGVMTVKYDDIKKLPREPKKK